MKNYNLSEIMKRAWEIKKEDERNIFGECLKMAWTEQKGKKVIMVKLVGTEKQVAWAEDLREEFNIIDNEDRVFDYNIGAVYGVMVQKMSKIGEYHKTYSEFTEEVKETIKKENPDLKWRDCGEIYRERKLKEAKKIIKKYRLVINEKMVNAKDWIETR